MLALLALSPTNPKRSLMRTKPTIIELPMAKLEDILRRVDTGDLNADDCRTIRELFQSYTAPG